MLVQKLARPINLMRFCSQGLLSAKKGAALQSERTGVSWKPREFGRAKLAVKAGTRSSRDGSFCCPPPTGKKTPAQQAETPSADEAPEKRAGSHGCCGWGQAD